MGESHQKAGFTRAKGLGEMTPTAVEESLFGKYKNWVQLKPANWPLFKKMVEDLMGKDVEVRRDYLFSKVNFDEITFL